MSVTARPRRSHRAVVVEALRAGRWRWLATAGWRALRALAGRPLRRPLFATLAVTWRCNYRCSFCDLPDRARGDPPLETLVARLEELAREGVLAVGLTGGEPLLHPRLLEVIAAARRLGMLVHLNSNGSRLTEAAVVPLVAAGLHSLNVSLDGAQAATHDRLRGVPGSFAQIERTVAALLAARRATTPRVALVMAIGPANAGEAAPFLALARRWGVDGAGFLPHHEFVEPRAPLAADAAAQLDATLREAAAHSRVLDSSPAYVGAIARYLAGAAMPERCSAPDHHVAVDPEGRRYPCVPLMTLERGGVAPGARPPPPDAATRADVCRRCWWNCHRELDLTLRRIAAPA